MSRPSHSRSDSYTDAGPATPSQAAKRQSRHSRTSSQVEPSSSSLTISTDPATLDMPTKTSSNGPIVTPPPRPNRRRPRSSAGAAPSASPPEEQRQSSYDDTMDDDDEHTFMELPAPLPDDAVSCHTLLITLHSTYEALYHDYRETSEKARQFRDEASDAAALRSIVDETLPGLKAQLEDERRKREEEEQNVRDLRQRVEEQRRALMRLQGGGGGGSTIMAAASTTNNGTVTGRDATKRRSVLGGLPGWMGASSATPAADEEESTADTAPTTSDEAEVMRKSKRASLAFGGGSVQARPGSAIGSRPTLGSQHRRTTSNGSANGAAGSGLRELRLGGAPGSAAPPSTSLLNAPPSDAVSNGGASSRRSSAHSAASGMGSALLGSNPPTFLSPGSQTSELPAVGDDGAPRNVRRDTMASDYSEASNFSQLSAAGGANQLGLSPSGGGLSGAPFAGSSSTTAGLGLARPPSVSPSQSGLQSPILEGDEQERTYAYSRFSNGEPTPTAMAPSLTLRGNGNGAAAASGTSVFTGQQRVASERTLLELSTKLKSRETEVAHLKRLQLDLERQLDEANEARQASDICLKALRDFVANSDAGAAGEADKAKESLEALKLPPLPTDRNVDEQEDAGGGGKKSAAATVGWTSRLGAGWRGLSSTSTSPAAGPNAGVSASPSSSSNQLARSDSQNSAVSAGAAGAAASPASPAGVKPLPPAAPARTSSNVSGLSLASMFGRSTAGSASATTIEEGSTTAPKEDGVASSSPTSSIGAAMPATPAPAATSSTAAPSSSSAAAKGSGFGAWFKRNSVLNAGPGAAASATESSTGSNATSKHMSVASPPFSSLDHSVLSPSLEASSSGVFDTQQQQQQPDVAPTTPSTAVPPIPATQTPAPEALEAKKSDIKPHPRAQRVASRTENVTEDEGFVAPAFD